jgi:DnaJ-domain-containing protein 1
MFPIQPMKEAAYSILKSHPNGIGEYQLLTTLHQKAIFPVGTKALQRPLTLYRTHFLLFHTLYQLKLDLLEQKKHDLTISALQICLTPYQKGEEALSPIDLLMHFYLNLSNLTGVQEEEVLQWLENFWQKMNESSQKAALELLGLPHTASFLEIKKTYRKKCMELHPDRQKGQEEAFKKLQQAWQVLRRNR